MPALDSCQPQVIRALQKEGWQVDARSKSLSVEARRVYIDLTARRTANGNTQQIFLAEVKCFLEPNQVTVDLYSAIGQYLVYRMILQKLNLTLPLYLTVPHSIYLSVFDSTIQQVLQDNAIRLIVINLDEERIVLWT